ncbi:hypothetical protein VP01_11021g1, partial [Puccinia sorghi]
PQEIPGLKTILMLNKLPQDFHSFKTNISMNFEKCPFDQVLKKHEDFASQNQLSNNKRMTDPMQTLYIDQSIQKSPALTASEVSVRVITASKVDTLKIIVIKSTLTSETPKRRLHLRKDIRLISPDTLQKTKKLLNTFSRNPQPFTSRLSQSSCT